MQTNSVYARILHSVLNPQADWARFWSDWQAAMSAVGSEREAYLAVLERICPNQRFFLFVDELEKWRFTSHVECRSILCNNLNCHSPIDAHACCVMSTFSESLMLGESTTSNRSVTRIPVRALSVDDSVSLFASIRPLSAAAKLTVDERDRDVDFYRTLALLCCGHPRSIVVISGSMFTPGVKVRMFSFFDFLL